MTVLEYGEDRIAIDAGLAFPRDEHLGVDLVLPDVSYLEGRRLRAIVLTHGHEDHVGGLPYALRKLDVGEVVGTRLTLALVKSKLDEHWLGSTTVLTEVEPRKDPFQLGPFRLEFVRDCALDPRLDGGRRRDARRAGFSTPGTGSSTTRPSTARRPTSARSRSSGAAVSTSCSATPRTRSGPG